VIRDRVIDGLRGRSALVTGGAGFIGSNLVEGLVQAGVEPIAVVDDLSLGRRENLAGALRTRGVSLVEGDCAVLDQLLEMAREPFDLCFNLAVIPLPHSLEHPRRNVDHNVAMTTAVCELWRAGRLGRLIHYSSSEVYGTAQTAPIAETHPLHPHTPYAAAKAATDLVAHSYSTTFGMPLVIVRPFNTYGERQNSGSYAGLIPAVVGRVLAGLPVQIYGDGLQTRDMIYVRDSVAGTLAAATCEDALGATVNLGRGEESSVNEMVRLILEVLGRPDHPVEHVEERPGDVRRLLADVTLGRRLFGFEAPTSLRDGLCRTVNWYVRETG
jgi:UDP-glucose 4-epimerase